MQVMNHNNELFYHKSIIFSVITRIKELPSKAEMFFLRRPRIAFECERLMRLIVIYYYSGKFESYFNWTSKNNWLSIFF